MIAAPRLATVGMKVFSSQSWSSDDLGGVLAADLGVEQVGVLGGGVVAPDRHLLDVGDRGAGLGGQLRDRPVVVEAGQRREPLLRDVGGVGHRDQRVGVGRVAGDADADVVGGDLVERLALRGEDRAVGREQVAALHARAARPGADEQREVDAVEDRLGVVADLDAGEVRERAVVELHDDALERLERRGDLEQPQLDRAVAQQRAAREAEQQAVADLAGGTGDGDLQRGRAHDDSSITIRDSWLPTLAARAPPAMLGSMTGREPLRRWRPPLAARRPSPGAAPRPSRARPRASTSSSSRRPSPDPDDFVEAVDNPWFPLEPGPTWTYDVAGCRRRRPARRSPSSRARRVAGVATTARDRPGAGRGRSSTGTPRTTTATSGGSAARGSGEAGADGAEAGLAMAARRRGSATATARRTPRAWSRTGPGSCRWRTTVLVIEVRSTSTPAPRPR